MLLIDETSTLDSIILAGGKGTRLQSVVSDRPKPLAEVAGRPFLEWLLLFLHSQGLQRVILATGYKGEMVHDCFGDGAQLGLDLAYSQEQTPLGTGGAARLALPQVTSEHVLVLNGDSFCPFDARRLLHDHLTNRARATIWLVPMDDCRRYGAVERAGDGRVLAFREKSPGLASGTINAGIYLFNRAVLDALPSDRPILLETELFPSLIDNGLYATIGTGPFLDIGTPESYAMATSFFTEHAHLWRGVS